MNQLKNRLKTWLASIVSEEIKLMESHIIRLNSQFRYLQIRLDRLDSFMAGDCLRSTQETELKALEKDLEGK